MLIGAHTCLGEPFDLVCSRLMLFHLKGVQEQAIRRMVECLRPGGWLFDEDCDWGTAAPVDPAHPRYDDYQRVWRDGDWWTPRGYDKVFGQKLPALLSNPPAVTEPRYQPKPGVESRRDCDPATGDAETRHA